MEELSFDTAVRARYDHSSDLHTDVMERRIIANLIDQLYWRHVVDHGLADTSPDQVGHYGGDANKTHHETSIFFHTIL